MQDTSVLFVYSSVETNLDATDLKSALPGYLSLSNMRKRVGYGGRQQSEDKILLSVEKQGIAKQGAGEPRKKTGGRVKKETQIID